MKKFPFYLSLGIGFLVVLINIYGFFLLRQRAGLTPEVNTQNLDKGKFLINGEYRFPIWKKLGGNVFVDGGLIWPSWSKIKINKAVVDFGWGLRYYLQNFVVRFDMGFSKEGTGIHFEFGHIF